MNLLQLLFKRYYKNPSRETDRKLHMALQNEARDGRGINRRKLTPEQRRADLAEYAQEQAAYLKTKSVKYAARLVTR